MRNVNLFLFKSKWLNFLFICILFSFTSLFAQTPLIDPMGDGGFENGATPVLNNWTAINSSTDNWIVNNVAGASAGINAAYISSTPGGAMDWTYSQVSVIQHLYYDVTIPSGEPIVTLQFKWKVGGEGTTTNDWDNMRVHWGLASAVTPVANTALATGFRVSGSGAISGMYKLNAATYNTETIVVSGVPGSTYRLVFSWKSDNTDIANPPAAIDEVSLVSSAPGNFVSAATGDWNMGATWVGGVAPTSLDNATITAGHTVTLNASSLAIGNLVVNGILQYGATPSSFNVNGNLTVNAGGTFNIFQGATGKTLNVAGNITNDGTIDISVGTTTAGNLTLNGTNVQTIGGVGSFNTSVIRNLTCSNTNTSTPNIIWNFSNIKVAYNLNLTGARINLNSNKITFGNAAAGNTLTAPIGTGFLPNGKFSRWWTTGATGTAVTAGTDPTNATSRYPFLDLLGQNRAIYISRTGSTAGNVAGELAVVYMDAVSMTTGLSIVDGAYTVTERYNGNWTVTTEATPYSHAGAHTVVLLGQNAYLSSNGNSRVMYASSIAGTHQNGTTTPGAQRTGLTTAQLTAGAIYMGINAADIPFLSVATGDWNDPSKWNKGVVPTCTDVVTILNGHNITINSTSNVSRNITINSGGTLTVDSGDLTVGCTLNNNILTNNGTLTVNGGNLNVNGNVLNASSSTFNQSGGDIIIDGNGATSVAGGTVLFAQNSGLGTVNGGTITIVDPPATGTARSFVYNVTTTSASWVGHTLKFGDGSSTAASTNVNGFEFDTYVGSGGLLLGNVIVDGGNTTNRWVSTSSSSSNGSDIGGNLTINLNSEFRNISAGTGALVGGNITNNGTLTTSTFLALGSLNGTTFIPSTVHQTISGSGTFRNSTTSSTASFANLQVFNSNSTGVTLSVPISISGLFTFDQGIVNTTSTNTLRLGTATLAGTLSGGSATAYVNGPFARTFPSSRLASGTYNQTTLFPVGKSATYLPIHIDPTTTAGGAVIFSGEAFTTNSGTGASGVTGLSNNRWEALISSGTGNFTSSNIRLNDATIVSSNKILQAASAPGTYGSIIPASTFTAGTPNTLNTTGTQILTADYNGYFAYGDLTPCTAPSNPPTSLTFSNLGSTSLTGTFTAANPSPNPTSNYLVVRYASGATPTVPVDFTAYTVGATLGTGNVRAVLTSPTVTFNDSGLSVGTTYDYYVYSYQNSACNGPVYLSTHLLGIVTTCAATTGTPGTPTATAITNLTFTATWTASSTPGVNYIIDVATDAGFTSLVSGFAAKNVGTALTDNVTVPNANTTYYVRVTADLAGCFSLPSSTLIVLTECNAISSFPAIEPFTTYLPNTCWKEGDLGDLTAGPNVISQLASSWDADGFLNSGTTGAAKINIDATGDNDWLITPYFTLPGTGYRVKYSVGATQWNSTTAPTNPWETDDFIELLVSTSTTNWTVLRTYNNTNVPSHLGQIDISDISAYNGQTVRFAFRGVEGASNGSADIDFFIDNFSVELTPIPTIASLGTLSGCPGNTLVINGANLEGATAANVQIGGTPVTSITSNTGSVLTVVVGNGTTGNVTVTIGANTATSTDTYTVNLKPTASATSNTPVCSGLAITLDGTTNAGVGATYAWSGPNSFASTSEDPTITLVTTAAAGTYTFTATSSAGCTSDPATTVVVVNPSPTPIVITQGSSVGKCAIAPALELNATDGVLNNIIILSENFNTAPVGWTTVNNSTSGTPSAAAWTLRPNSYTYSSTTFNSNDASQFYLSNSDAQGSGGITATILNTPVIDLSNFTSANLNFWHYYRYLNIESAKVEVSLNNSTWTTLVTYSSTQGNASSFNNVNIDLSAYIGNSTVYIRFKYDATYDYYWAIDNVLITGNQQATITWSPSTGLFTDAGGAMAYNGLDNAPTIYASPSSTQSYTVTATSALGCTSTASINVVIEGSTVTSTADAGPGTLRAALACVVDGGTIMYDQPATSTTVLTAPLTIDKNVTIMGASASSRPEITTSTSGISINAMKTLTLKDVDVKSTAPTQTFTGAGDVSITGTTVGKQ